MNTKPLFSAVLMAMACFAGAAAAQDFDRRGPNVMPAPYGNGNYYNNTNTYNHSAVQDRRGPNVMPGSQSNAQERVSPRAARPAAPVEREAHTAQADPRAPGAAARGTGPNIEGEATSMPSESTGGRGDRRGAVIPGCDKCVAI